MDQFFVNEKKEVKELPIRQTKKELIPPEYLKVNLSSLGKLGMPPVIHVKDYTGEDALKLALATEENLLSTLISVLNNMVYEDIDASDFHENDIIEILLNVYVNFWDTQIKNYPFPITDEEWDNIDDERKKRVINRIEKLEVDINLHNLKTSLIAKEFNEPITIQREDCEIEFILPRIGHLFQVEDYIEKKYIREVQEFQRIQNLVEYNNKVNKIEEKKQIDQNELKKYQEYIDRKVLDITMIKRSLLLKSYNGEELDTLEKKIEAYKKIDQQMWVKYFEVQEKYTKFGVDFNIEMESPLNKEKVTRRCRFQLLDFIPYDGLQRDEKFSVSFG